MLFIGEIFSHPHDCKFIKTPGLFVWGLELAPTNDGSNNKWDFFFVKINYKKRLTCKLCNHVFLFKAAAWVHHLRPWYKARRVYGFFLSALTLRPWKHVFVLSVFGLWCVLWPDGQVSLYLLPVSFTRGGNCFNKSLFLIKVQQLFWHPLLFFLSSLSLNTTVGVGVEIQNHSN